MGIVLVWSVFNPMKVLCALERCSIMVSGLIVNTWHLVLSGLDSGHMYCHKLASLVDLWCVCM